MCIKNFVVYFIQFNETGEIRMLMVTQKWKGVIKRVLRGDEDDVLLLSLITRNIINNVNYEAQK